MNPGSSETGGLNLPPPVGGEASPAVESGENRQPRPELAARPEVNHQAGQAAPATTAIPLPASPIPVAAPVPVPAASSAQTTDSADGGDLIEKEWVNKAKAIVEKTRDNPHEQSKELNVVKADYLKQHYDKNIKVNS